MAFNIAFSETDESSYTIGRIDQENIEDDHSSYRELSPRPLPVSEKPDPKLTPSITQLEHDQDFFRSFSSSSQDLQLLLSQTSLESLLSHSDTLHLNSTNYFPLDYTSHIISQEKGTSQMDYITNKEISQNKNSPRYPDINLIEWDGSSGSVGDSHSSNLPFSDTQRALVSTVRTHEFVDEHTEHDSPRANWVTFDNDESFSVFNSIGSSKADEQRFPKGEVDDISHTKIKHLPTAYNQLLNNKNTMPSYTNSVVSNDMYEPQISKSHPYQQGTVPTISHRELVMDPVSLAQQIVPNISEYNVTNNRGVRSEYFRSQSEKLSRSSSIADVPNNIKIPDHKFVNTIPFTIEPNVIMNDLKYNTIQEEQLQDNQTMYEKRSKFSFSKGNNLSTSMSEGSKLDSHVSLDLFKTVKARDAKVIFKTSSSASLLRENSSSSGISSGPDLQLRPTLSRIRSWFSDKLTGTDYTPLDDSMDFVMQPSMAPQDLISFTSQSAQDLQEIHGKIQPFDAVAKEPEPEEENKADKKTAIYKRRWYLLFLFSMSALLWNAVWSTWGPIAQSAKVVYDWTDGDIAMFVWLGNIPFLITMFPSSYLMDVTGMRASMIVACLFMFLGTGLRCIPSDISTASWLIRVGQFMNGMAGSIPNSGPALLSGLWFPPNQRASATAISTVAGYIGASISFIVGPLLVPQPSDLLPVNNTYEEAVAVTASFINMTAALNNHLDMNFNSSTSYSGHNMSIFSSSSYLDITTSRFEFLETNFTNATNYQAQKDGIMTILYGEFILAGILLLLVLIYFPSKPPLPPSVSASIPREKYIKGLKMLVRNKQFWVCALAFSIPAGVYEAWQVILDVILDDFKVDQQTAGWLDFGATMGGVVSGLLVSRFADFFTRQIKLFLLVFYFFASVSILWFILVVMDLIPYDKLTMFAAIILSGVFIDGGGPLFFELTIEVSYPVGEGVTSGFTQMLCALAGIVFLSVVQVQSLGKQWINWCFFGCVSVAVPLLFFIDTTYGRADIDDLDPDDDTTPPSATTSPSPTDAKFVFGTSDV